MARWLIDKGADIDSTTKSRESKLTPLHTACLYNNADCAVRLVEHGANIHSRSSGGWTALHFACHTPLVENSHSHVEARAKYTKRTPLHIACLYYNFDCAAFLVERGANLHADDYGGLTPYQIRTDLVGWLQKRISKSNQHLAAWEQKMNDFFQAGLLRLETQVRSQRPPYA